MHSSTENTSTPSVSDGKTWLEPQAGPGLYYMDTSSAAAECVTLMAAGGYVSATVANSATGASVTAEVRCP